METCDVCGAEYASEEELLKHNLAMNVSSETGESDESESQRDVGQRRPQAGAGRPAWRGSSEQVSETRR